MIKIGEIEIRIKKVGKEDYISLTDMAIKRSERRPDELISDWLRNLGTLQFIEAWERFYNPNFNSGQMPGFYYNETANRKKVTVKKLVEMTGAIGIRSQAGRGGGTYAHVDIAFEFGTWLDPAFKLALIVDYRRMKEAENPRLEYSRFLAKVNYGLQTDAIEENIIPRLGDGKSKNMAYAIEADMLNQILFGMTARQWREANPELASSGLNMRDCASPEELHILANMESHNEDLISKGASQEARARSLAAMAERQLARLTKANRLLTKDQ